MHDELNPIQLKALIEQALLEDLAGGDITTLSTVAESKMMTGRLIAKEAGVICGLPVFSGVYACLDKKITVTPDVKEGAFVEAGDEIAHLYGPARGLLSGERTALNFLQRLSAIATRTRLAVEQVKESDAAITDTRKTTPGLRMLEKYAVRMGGGRNHRFNLSDGILIKDNHIQAAGGVEQAISRARMSAPHTLKIEVEVENTRQIAQALDAGADIIMLDNMTAGEIRQAVRQIDGRAMVEISGNMGERDLRQLAMTGVNLISIGALTHSVKAMDISLKLSETQGCGDASAND